MAKSPDYHTHSWNRGVFGALRTIMHVIAAVHFWYAIWFDYTKVRIPESHHKMGNTFGGKFKYLTFLDAIIQAIYFTVSVLNDIVGTNELTPKRMPAIRKFKDYLLASLAFPVAMNVGISFWTLMAIDRELVFPKAFDAFFPSWLNHIMHTNIMVFIVLEMCISFRQYPSRSKGLTGLTVFMGSYLVWLHIVKYYSGIWVYPVLEVLEMPQRILFFVGILAITLGLYFVGELFNKMIWTKELKQMRIKTK